MLFSFRSDLSYLQRYLSWKDDQPLVPLINRLRLHRQRLARLQRWSSIGVLRFIAAPRLRLFHDLMRLVLDALLGRVRQLLTLSDSPKWRILVDDVVGAGSQLRFYGDFPQETLQLLKRLVQVRIDRVIVWLFSLWDPWGYLRWTAADWAREMRRFLQSYDGCLRWRSLTRSDFAQLAFWLGRPIGKNDRVRPNTTCRICHQRLTNDQAQISCPRSHCGYRFHETCLGASVTDSLDRYRIPKCPVCQAIWTRSRTWDLVKGVFQPPIPDTYLRAIQAR